MPDTKLRMPGAPDPKDNLLHGGRRNDTCLRCGKWRGAAGKNAHGVPEVPENPALRKALGQIVAEVRADTSTRTKRKDGREEETTLQKEAFMIGVLEAKIRGVEYRFVASSGNQDPPWVQQKHLKSLDRPKIWTLTDTPLPNSRKGWKNIRWGNIDLPESITGVTSPCAAMKLLAALAGKVAGSNPWGPVEYVRLAEEYYRGPDFVPEIDRRTGRPKEQIAWRGEGSSGKGPGSWTAHSCGPCEQRIPYLICDRPAAD
ncbi:hypothetical protein [Streptomyces hesseae]|uniref:Uncharacterized protein n=1 Tax=Streptomyces hesseae TaxID=3075519 RepID=A0ABU2SRJ6_9ACTN|nr:hypothetical protein [Streptomyces sp. DSM 40473]MDT0451628.1 hypothetical protein [Streptomyces sp. DSM 40473]